SRDPGPHDPAPGRRAQGSPPTARSTSGARPPGTGREPAATTPAGTTPSGNATIEKREAAAAGPEGSDARHSSGAPLPGGLAARLEPHVGRAAAGSARLHTDAAADRVAAAHHARAVTVGDDIYFARGEYTPGTQRGDELLVHELTHVAQG